MTRLLLLGMTRSEGGAVQICRACANIYAIVGQGFGRAAEPGRDAGGIRKIRASQAFRASDGTGRQPRGQCDADALRLAVDSARRDCRGGVRDRNSLLFSRVAVGARFRISPLHLAGSSLAVEAGDFLSAMGGAGAVWFWRASVYFLSAGVVDFGRRAERDLSLEAGLEYLHLDRTGSCGGVDVSACPAVARPARCYVRGCVVCSESLPSSDCLLAERVR